MIYDRHPIWNVYGRCIGPSGFPYFRDKFTEGSVVERGPQNTTWRKVTFKNMVPGGLILEGPNPYIPGHEHEYGHHSYRTIKFEDEQLNEIVHAPDGSPVYARQLT